jgi:hypothetical protein
MKKGKQDVDEEPKGPSPDLSQGESVIARSALAAAKEMLAGAMKAAKDRSRPSMEVFINKAMNIMEEIPTDLERAREDDEEEAKKARAHLGGNLFTEP